VGCRRQSSRRAHTCRCTSRAARKRRRAAVRGGQFAPPSPASASSTFAASSECSSTVRGCHHAPAAINRTAATLRRLNSSDSRLPAEVAVDRLPEVRGEMERLPLVAQEDVVTLDTGRSARRPSPREAARRARPVHRVVDWRLGPAGV